MGLIRVHKPEGATSFSVVEPYLAKGKAVHGGALDPFASGLLLVMTGPSVKLFSHLHAVPKTYVAKVKWGVETHNFDPTGRVTRELPVGDLSGREAALKKFFGWTFQVPPSTSNKRVDGERAWARVARGEEVTLKPERVYLHAARWRSEDEFECTVRGGFYVRSLARDVAAELGTCAHLLSLKRTAIGPWDDVTSPVEVKELLPWLPSRELSDAEVAAMKQRKALAPVPLKSPTWPLPEGFPGEDAVRAFYKGKLRAVLKPDGTAATYFSGGV